MDGARAGWYDHRCVSYAIRTRADILQRPAALVHPCIVRPVVPADGICPVEPEQECVGDEDLFCVEEEVVLVDESPVRAAYAHSRSVLVQIVLKERRVCCGLECYSRPSVAGEIV